MTDKEIKLFDWIGSISETKKLNLTSYNDTNYNIFVINKAFGQHKDTILFANEMNKLALANKKAHFLYLNNTIRKKKRYGKWAKESKNENIDLIMDLYPEMSRTKAKQVEHLLINEIDEIKKKLYKGGVVK